MATTKGKMEATLAFVWVDGARPPEYRKALVRDRHTGRLVDVPLTELPPLDEGSDGTTYVFSKGEQVSRDHPAALAKPQYFVPVEE